MNGGRPVRESRTPVNAGNQPRSDDGEAVAGITLQPPSYPLRSWMDASQPKSGDFGCVQMTILSLFLMFFKTL